MSLIAWALWGLAGAFVYAAPKLIVALFDDGVAGRRARAIAEFVVSLSFGPIAAAAFGPFAAGELHRTSVSELRAGAVVIGMIVNPVAPSIVRIFSDNVLRWAGHPLANKRSPP